MYENLIFEGGGIKGVAYAKVPLALHELGILQNIRRIAGSSAGSIAAVLIALRYNPIEIQEIISKTKFDVFTDKMFYTEIGLKLICSDGIYNGNYFSTWIQDHILIKAGKKNITFMKLFKQTNIELVITGTSLETGKTEYFSYKTAPDMEVWRAVRISITIPIFFKPIKYNNKLYLDGGILSNFPIWIFDNPGSYELNYANLFNPNPLTLGFKLISNKDVSQVQKLPIPIPIVRMSINLVSLLIDYIDDSYEICDYWDRTIGINVLNVKAVDFETPEETLNILQENGYKSTIQFITNKIKANNLINKLDNI